MSSSAEKPLVILEIANNHMGDIAHGKALINAMAAAVKPFRDNFDFAVKDSMKDLYSIAEEKNINELNLFVGSFYFSGEIFKYLLKSKNLPISISSLREVI